AVEALQGRQVTIGGVTYALPDPALVLATQKPIEQEGTYPLPEAQIDRFMMKVIVGYPGREEEREILRRMSGAEPIAVSRVAGPDEIRHARTTISRLYLDEKVGDYILDLVQATRSPRDFGLFDLAPLVEYGASPRATRALGAAARAHANLRGREFVLPDDVQASAKDVLRHRIIDTYAAEAEEVTGDDIVTRVLATIAVP